MNLRTLWLYKFNLLNTTYNEMKTFCYGYAKGYLFCQWWYIQRVRVRSQAKPLVGNVARYPSLHQLMWGFDASSSVITMMKTEPNSSPAMLSITQLTQITYVTNKFSLSLLFPFHTDQRWSYETLLPSQFFPRKSFGQIQK